ncbi:hypothetical protein BGX27_000560 [Mortierella sp. AM989]|nr:hypothetical protein BGX27_000560 [Mortierella sp. AM989]
MLDHEGVMIQCETCKVWQHCPCVGLGNGEVTPDKYYCESCRPENHPYRVQDGQLISSSKKASQAPSVSANSKPKSSKKRSTMNSKDASFLTGLSSSEQNNDDYTYEAMLTGKVGKSGEDSNGYGHNRAPKRRKKSEGCMDEDGYLNNGNASSPKVQSNKEYKDNHVPADNDPEPYTDSTNTSLKALSKNKNSRSSKSKTVINKASAGSSLPNSPRDFNDKSKETHDIQASKPPSPHQQTSRKIGGKKGTRLTENGTVAVADKTSPASKKKKVSKSETAQFDGSSPDTDHYDELNQVFAKESSMEPLNASAPNGCHDPYSTQTTKRVGSRKAHPHTAHPDTPTPTGTPQPMQPAPPAKVKYPSSRMSLKDMNKRAQQLLEYIARVQVEMVELKDRSNQTSPTSTESDNTPLVKSQGLTVDTGMQSLKAGSSDSESRWLSTPPQSVHELSHTDGSEHTTKVPLKQGVNQSDTSGSSGDQGKVPMTPPHQPMIASHGFSEPVEEDCSDAQKTYAENSETMGSIVVEVTSLDLMDKLTGDLICFQKRFGRSGTDASH